MKETIGAAGQTPHLPVEPGGGGGVEAGASPQNLQSLKSVMRKSLHPPPNDERVWKPVPGYTDIFASHDGEVWSAKTGTLKNQRSSSNGKGYKAIWLWEKGRDRERRVHRLVALAFHGMPPSQDHTPDHINRNKADNRAENLRWATPKEQAQNSSRQKSFITTEC